MEDIHCFYKKDRKYKWNGGIDIYTYAYIYI